MSDGTQWQYFIPGLAAGLLEISVVLKIKPGIRHCRQLLRLRFGLKRLPPGTMVGPYFSFGAALLRDRAREEQLQIDDRLQTAVGAGKPRMKRKPDANRAPRG